MLSKCGLVNDALQLFQKMQQTDTKLDEYLYASIISACTIAKEWNLGKQLYQKAMQSGLANNIVQNATISLFAKAGDVDTALSVFSIVPQKDVVSWNAIIGAFGQVKNVDKALESFSHMKMAGIAPDGHTY